MTICMVSVDLHAVASISAHMSSAYYIIIEMETLIFFSCYIVSLNLVPVQQKRLQSFSEKEGKEKDLMLISTPSVSFYLSLDSVILHYPTTNKKKRREY
jgi:hypothetical protein